MKQHMEFVSNGNELLKCTICADSFEEERKFVKKSSIFSECPECDFDTKEENLLEKHVTENHPYFQNLQSVILTPKKKICWKNMSQKIIHIFRKSRV
jgi:uncharacterized C2H2 Zn-finger protein